jgi:peptidase M50-like protein
MSTDAGALDFGSSTPILDRVKPVPKPRERSWLVSFFGHIGAFVFLGLCVLPGALLLDAIAFPSQRVITSYVARAFAGQTTLDLLLSFLFWQYPAIAIHEIGHLAAGLFVGMRLNSFRVGPVEISPHFRLRFRWKMRRFGGLVSMVPSGKKSLRVRELVVTCGGPFASLAAAATVLFVQVRTRSFSPFVCMFVLTAGFQGLLSLLPGSSDGISWDGRTIWTLLFDKGRRATFLAIMRITIDWLEGNPVDEFDLILVNKVLSRPDHSWEKLAVSAYAYSVALEEKRDQDAGGFLEICLAHLDLADEPEQWFAQAVYFQAVRRKCPALARQWLEEIPAKTRIPGIRLQAEAATLQGQDQIEGALQKLDHSLLLVSEMPRSALRRRLLQALEKWKLELEKETIPALA